MAAGFQDKVKIILAEKNTRKMTPYSEIKTQTSLFSQNDKNLAFQSM